MSENKLIKAYNHFMEYTYEAMDDTVHSIADSLDIGQVKLTEMGNLSAEEIRHIAEAASRDIHYAAHSLTDNSHDSLATWLKFDISLLENFALDVFLEVADKTRLELNNIANNAEQYSHIYKAEDVTGPGSFRCEQCGKVIAFKAVGIIPECPECGATIFVRI
jgi:rubrerythrin